GHPTCAGLRSACARDGKRSAARAADTSRSDAPGWSVLSFGSPSLVLCSLCALEQLDPLTGSELHDGLLPCPRPALVQAATLRLRAHLRGAHRGNLDVEDLF